VPKTEEPHANAAALGSAVLRAAGRAQAPAPCSPPAPEAWADADVEVTVVADHGPRGTKVPAQVDRKLYGANIADWRPEDYVPAPDPTFVAYLGALRPGVLRWPGRTQEYVWPRVAGGQSGPLALRVSDFDAFVELAKRVDAEPLIGINVKRSNSVVAADIVRYLNIEKGYGVRYFQIGNEPDYVDGLTAGPRTYAVELNAFADAMRAVDPSIRIVGPELLSGAHVGGMYGTVDWMTPILAQTAGRIDAISWHYYPLDSGQAIASSSAVVSVAHLFQETAPDWPPAGLGFIDTVMPALGALRDAHAPGASIWVTEFAEDPGPNAGRGVSDTVAGALWGADALGRYAEYAPGAVLRWLFESVPEHAYALLDGHHVPRPTYGAYWLLARHMGDRFVDAKSAAVTAVAAHAALREDGALAVVLVNKTEVAKKVHVTIAGHCYARADSLTFEGGTWAAKDFRIDGHVLDAATAVNGIAPSAVEEAGLTKIEVPAASIRLIAYRR
jgi:hypothetical protein